MSLLSSYVSSVEDILLFLFLMNNVHLNLSWSYK